MFSDKKYALKCCWYCDEYLYSIVGSHDNEACTVSSTSGSRCQLVISRSSYAVNADWQMLIGKNGCYAQEYLRYVVFCV